MPKAKDALRPALVSATENIVGNMTMSAPKAAPDAKQITTKPVTLPDAINAAPAKPNMANGMAINNVFLDAYHLAYPGPDRDADSGTEKKQDKQRARHAWQLQPVLRQRKETGWM